MAELARIRIAKTAWGFLFFKERSIMRKDEIKRLYLFNYDRGSRG